MKDTPVQARRPAHAHLGARRPEQCMPFGKDAEDRVGFCPRRKCKPAQAPSNGLQGRQRRGGRALSRWGGQTGFQQLQNWRKWWANWLKRAQLQAEEPGLILWV